MLEQNVNLLGVGFFVLLHLLHYVSSQSQIPHIPLGSKLSVSTNSSWVSPNGNFALGFFNTSDESKNKTQYSLGIRFNSDLIPVQSRPVIWVAGADLSVGKDSIFTLTNEGEFVLFDSSKGVNVWTSKTRSGKVFSGALTDEGNLVLLSFDVVVVWQSFDFPSDTLVPGQSFSAFHTLRAKSFGSVSSYYSLFMDSSSARLRLRWESSVDYWASSPTLDSDPNLDLNSNENFTARFDSVGELKIVSGLSHEPVWSIFGEDHNELLVRFRFLRLDPDGNFRMYSWDEASMTWRTVWQAVENQCEVFGTCGRRGLCVYDSVSGLPGCECPFKLVNETVPSCLIPFPKRCHSGFYMMTLENMNLYAMYPPGNDFVVPEMSLKECERLCFRDALCTSATFLNDGSARCSVKKTQYVGGFSDPSLRSVSFVKRCSDPMAVDPNLAKTMEKNREKGLSKKGSICFSCLVGAVSATTLIFVAFQIAVVVFVFRKRRSVVAMNKKKVLARSGSSMACDNGPIVLSFPEIEEITESFAHRIGPSMFKGTLSLRRNRPVAVKDLTIRSSTITLTEERKYRAAMSKLGSIHHKNLVKLEGYCCDSGRRLLVYEYAENGSVDKHLADPKLAKKMTWAKRVEICVSVARAVCYLHTGCREFVGHGNLKCENVVLDEDLEAKVSEFGLYSLAAGEAIAAEKDVEDFGRTVLVLVTGLDSNEDVFEWAFKEWFEGTAENTVDKRIVGLVGPEELDRVLRIAFWCLQSDERMRPSMREVVKVLEGTLSVDPPPPPFSRRRQFEIDNDDDGDGLSDAGSEPNAGRF